MLHPVGLIHSVWHRQLGLQLVATQLKSILLTNGNACNSFLDLKSNTTPFEN